MYVYIKNVSFCRDLFNNDISKLNFDHDLTKDHGFFDESINKLEPGYY